MNGVVLRRINRFVAEIDIGGETVEAYLNNTGRLIDYITYGKKCFCLENKGRLRYRIFAVEDQGYSAVIDTSMQERVFEKLISMNAIEYLDNCRVVKRNPRLNDSLLDYLVACMDRQVYVELKSAVLRVDNVYASYPDAPSSRAKKQFLNIIDHVSRGGASIVIFLCSLPFIKGFVFNRDVDEKLHEIVVKAMESGVVFKAIQLHYDQWGNAIVVGDTDLPVHL